MLLMTAETTAILPTRYSLATGDITSYLFGKDLITSDDLPAHLSLGLYSPAMRRLYSQSKDTFIVSDFLKDQAVRGLEKWRATPKIKNLIANPWGKETVEEAEQDFLRTLSRKAAAEREALIFMDPSTYEIGTTRIVHGEYGRVQSDNLSEVILSGKVPLMRLHTHPTDSLFSPIDYLSLIADYPGKGRAMKSISVLCPNYQILALATNQTTLLSRPEATRLAVEWRHIIQGDDDKDARAVKSTSEQLILDHNKYAEASLQRLALRTQNIFEGVPTSLEEFEEIRAEAKKAHVEVEKAYKDLEEREKGNRQILSELENWMARFSNGKILEFARTINVALYISTNTMNFYKFSA